MTLTRIWQVLVASFILLFALQAQANPKNIAVLQGLDKVTARVTTFNVGVDQSVDFGALRIRVRYCDRTSPEEQPEATAFIEIDELRPGQDQKVLFTGWMFASSPGLNGVEHAVYDVWVLDCIDAVPEENSASAEGTTGGGGTTDTE